MDDIDMSIIWIDIKKNIMNWDSDLEEIDFNNMENEFYQEVKFNLDEFQLSLNYLIHNWRNDLNINTSSSSPVISFLKKNILRCLFFIIMPFVDFQNLNNKYILKCLIQTNEYIKESQQNKEKIAFLEKEIELLRKEIKDNK